MGVVTGVKVNVEEEEEEEEEGGGGDEEDEKTRLCTDPGDGHRAGGVPKEDYPRHHVFINLDAFSSSPFFPHGH